jgi:putative transposase
MPNSNNISENTVKAFYVSRNLPHMFEVDKPIFITYRLRFTLPKALLVEYNRQKENWQQALQQLDLMEQIKVKANRDGLFFKWYDEMLAKSEDTPQILHREDIRAIISESFLHFDKMRYHLLAYCIMPNHVHVLIYPMIQETGQIYPPARIIYSWKTYTARLINKALNRSGSLWQYSCYDRMVRNEIELGNVLEYIVMNPVKAHLVDDWKRCSGNYVCPELKDGIRW